MNTNFLPAFVPQQRVYGAAGRGTEGALKKRGVLLAQGGAVSEPPTTIKVPQGLKKPISVVLCDWTNSLFADYTQKFESLRDFVQNGSLETAAP